MAGKSTLKLDEFPSQKATVTGDFPAMDDRPPLSALVDQGPDDGDEEGREALHVAAGGGDGHQACGWKSFWGCLVGDGNVYII